VSLLNAFFVLFFNSVVDFKFLKKLLNFIENKGKLVFAWSVSQDLAILKVKM
jgi:hypothetical protein